MGLKSLPILKLAGPVGIKKTVSLGLKSGVEAGLQGTGWFGNMVSGKGRAGVASDFSELLRV